MTDSPIRKIASPTRKQLAVAVNPQKNTKYAKENNVDEDLLYYASVPVLPIKSVPIRTIDFLDDDDDISEISTVTNNISKSNKNQAYQLREQQIKTSKAIEFLEEHLELRSLDGDVTSVQEMPPIHLPSGAYCASLGKQFYDKPNRKNSLWEANKEYSTLEVVEALEEQTGFERETLEEQAELHHAMLDMFHDVSAKEVYLTKTYTIVTPLLTQYILNSGV